MITNFKQQMAEILELPKELILNVPKLTLIGNNIMSIQNFRSLIEYSNTQIKIKTNSGLILIQGNKLSIKEISTEDTIIEGEIQRLEFGS